MINMVACKTKGYTSTDPFKDSSKIYILQKSTSRGKEKTSLLPLLIIADKLRNFLDSN